MAIIAVAAIGVAGCSSDFDRLQTDPIYTGSTANQRAILGQSGGDPAAFGGNAYAGQPSEPRSPVRNWSSGDTVGSVDQGQGDVYRRDLAPPTPSVYTPPPSTSVARPTADAAPGPTRVAAAGGWTPAGGSYVTMRQGETLDTLSTRYGVPVAALRQTNGWAPGRVPAAGERVLIPVYSSATTAPQSAPAAAPARPAPQAALQPAPMPPQRVATAPAPRTLVAPTTTGSVPPTAAQTRTAAAPAPAAQPGVKLVGAYTVRQGDTLAGIARTYSVSEQALRERNGLKTATIVPGQQLLLPAGTKLMLKTAKAPEPAATQMKPPVATARIETPTAKPVVTARVEAPTAKPVATAKVEPAAVKPVAVAKVEAKPAAKAGQKAVETDTSKIDQKAAETIAVAREPAPGDDDKASAGSGSFRWPVRGRIISEYGAKANGERNEGINMAVPEGTSVKAADDGEVIYAGNELKGYGNLVLVRHSNGFVSAYAHASELLVNRGDKVSRGQIIARAGATGSVSQPQLHFELRKGQKAVDPKPYLASN